MLIQLQRLENFFPTSTSNSRTQSFPLPSDSKPLKTLVPEIFRNFPSSQMAEPSDHTANQEEFREENVQPAEENQQEEPNEGMPAEAPEGPTVPEERTKKGKKKVAEEEIEDFVSEEAYSNWRKHYAGKGFVAERRFKNPITPFKEMIEKRGWETFCAHRRAGYAAVVREFYSNMVGRKDNIVYVRGVWVPYGA